MIDRLITKPFDHQWESFIRGVKDGNLINFSEMGTGKTKVSIDLMKYWLLNGAKNALIICPKSALYNWESECKMNGVTATVVRGLSAKRRALLDEQICIMNYESARATSDYIFLHPFEILILDESHKIKNHKAAVTKFFLKLRPTAKHVVIMTGTPVTDNLWDIWSQMHFAKPKQVFDENFYVFRHRYFVKVSDQLSIWKPYKDSDKRINEKIIGHIVRFTKEECLDLPEKVYTDLPLEFIPIQQQHYYELATDMLTRFDDKSVTTCEYKLTLSLRLSQVTSGHLRSNEGNLETFPTPKDEAVKDIMENSTGRVVIFARFRPDIFKLTEILKSYNPAVVFGDVVDRQAEIDRFTNDEKCRVFIGQIQTAGIALNLQVANTVVYYSQGYSLLERMQSEDRCHRIGQKNKVQYINLLIKDSVDEVIWKCLKRKKVESEIVVDIHNHIKEVANA